MIIIIIVLEIKTPCQVAVLPETTKSVKQVQNNGNFDEGTKCYKTALRIVICTFYRIQKKRHAIIPP